MKQLKATFIALALLPALAVQPAFGEGNPTPLVDTNGGGNSPSGLPQRRPGGNIDIGVKKYTGEDALTAFEMQLIEQKLALMNDKKRLKEIEVSLRSSESWRNGSLVVTLGLGTLTALAIKYGSEDTALFGGLAGGIGTLSAGSIAGLSQANLNGLQSEVAGINSTIEQRLDIIKEMEARVQALRTTANKGGN